MGEAYGYRDDPDVPAFPDDRPILIFDGKCVLCSGFVQFILRNDRQGRLRLLAAQTPTGAALYRHFGLRSADYETNILLEDGRAWLKSEGSLRIFERLGFPWSLIAVGRILPRPVRDGLYEVIARNRLLWFGSRDSCLLPDPSHADRFIA
ncbi:MAG: DCC1-like thiol-disulfide oxidoreductase family protein [Caulobacteraceae bacterium]